jgi:hypothetical protein
MYYFCRDEVLETKTMFMSDSRGSESRVRKCLLYNTTLSGSCFLRLKDALCSYILLCKRCQVRILKDQNLVKPGEIERKFMASKIHRLAKTIRWSTCLFRRKNELNVYIYLTCLLPLFESIYVRKVQQVRGTLMLETAREKNLSEDTVYYYQRAYILLINRLRDYRHNSSGYRCQQNHSSSKSKHYAN